MDCTFSGHAIDGSLYNNFLVLQAPGKQQLCCGDEVDRSLLFSCGELLVVLLVVKVYCENEFMGIQNKSLKLLENDVSSK